jgi:hypothetical protein
VAKYVDKIVRGGVKGRGEEEEEAYREYECMRAVQICQHYMLLVPWGIPAENG